MPRLRRARSLAHHARLAEAAARPESLRPSLAVYALRHAVAHALAAGRPKDAAALLCDFAWLQSWTASLPPDACPALVIDHVAVARVLARDAEGSGGGVAEGGGPPSAPKPSNEALHAWAAFLRERVHLLRRGTSDWPANRILLHLAVEYADDSPVTQAADAWLAAGGCTWTWLRRSAVQRPRSRGRSGLLAVLEGHTDTVRGALELDDGRVVSWADDGTVRTWDRRNGLPGAVMGGDPIYVRGAALLPGGTLVAWSREALRQWDLATATCIATVPDARGASTARFGHPPPLWQGIVAALLDEARVLVCFGDLYMEVWGETSSGPTLACMLVLDAFLLVPEDDEDPKPELVEAEHLGGFALPDGRLLTWGVHRVVALWDSQSGDLLGRLVGHLDVVRGALRLPDGSVLTWSNDGTLRRWDVARETCVATFVGHAGPVVEARVTADGQVVSRSLDGSVCRWDTDSGRCLEVNTPETATGTDLDDRARGAGHTGRVLGAVQLRDGAWVSWSEDRTLRVWREVEFGVGATRVEGAPDSAAAHAATDRSRVDGVAAVDGGARWLTWERGAIDVCVHDGYAVGTAKRLQGHTGAIVGATQLVDGRFLSWSRDGSMRVWDARNHEVLHVLAGHDGTVEGVLELEGGWVVSRASDSVLRCWDTRTGRIVATMADHAQAIRGMCLLADGQVLSWSRDATLRVWAPLSGRQARVLAGHRGAVTGARVLADGSVLSWSVDRTIRRWDIVTGETLATMVGHRDKVGGAARLEDGRVLSWCRGRRDMTFRFWDARTGEQVHAEPREAARAWELGVMPLVVGDDSPGAVHCGSAVCASRYDVKFQHATQVALWHTDGAWTAHVLLGDGTVVVAREGEFAVLMLYRGNARVSVEEAEQGAATDS